MNAPRVIHLGSDDNVVIAVDVVGQGDMAHAITARQKIMKGHKMAIRPVREGEPIVKFGQIIGFATSHIAPGEWVHEHNVGLHGMFERVELVGGRLHLRTRPGGGVALRVVL